MRPRSLALLGLLAFGLAAGAAHSETVYDVFARRWPGFSAPRDPHTIAVRTLAYARPVSGHPQIARKPALPPAPPPRSEAKTAMIKFASAPFPYDGLTPGGAAFLNVHENGRKGHRTWRGGVLWEDKTFGDNRVLLHIPRGFDIKRPAVMVVFFHGHGADLERDVLRRQKVPAQITQSGMNAVLVAPQFAFDAADSSAGRFWQPGGFGRFITEAGKTLAALDGHPEMAGAFSRLPIVLIAYSGGYSPAAWSIRNGHTGKQIKGLVLMDGLYGEIGEYARWIRKSNHGFFISAYTQSTRRQNHELADILKEQKVPFRTGIDKHLWRGGVAFLAMDEDVRHRDFVTQAWTGSPIADILDKLN